MFEAACIVITTIIITFLIIVFVFILTHIVAFVCYKLNICRDFWGFVGDDKYVF
jgi:hypothetical protein